MKTTKVLLVLVTVVAAGLLMNSCGGTGGGTITPPPGSGGGTITSPPPVPAVTVSASPTTVLAGASSTLTWSSTNASSCSISGGGLSGSVQCSGSQTVSPTQDATYTVTASGAGGTANGSATVLVALAVSITPPVTNLFAGGNVGFTAIVTGGDGNQTVSWSANPSLGSFLPASGMTTTYTAPSSLTTSPQTVTITAAVTDGSGASAQQASAGMMLTLTRVSMTIGINIPNYELYSDFGTFPFYTMTCMGCEATDTLNTQSVTFASPVEQQPLNTIVPLTSWPIGFNFTGPLYAPSLLKLWISGADGVVSNTLWITFDGSQNMTVEDPTSGEIYYDYSGNGSQGSFSTLKYKQDGTADGTLTWVTSSFTAQWGGYGVAVDDTTHDILFTGGGGAEVADSNGNELAVVTMGNTFANPPATYSLAIDAKNGLACATQPAVDTANCFHPPTQFQVNAQVFPLPSLPPGSQPTAVKVLDANDVIVYGRGDQTLRWFTISGTTATAAGTLQLATFSPTNSNYWTSIYQATGGWDLVQVGTTLGMMGQVVNADGTVSQKLALVDGTAKALIQYVDLPKGNVHIAADPTHNAIVAEYPDFTVSPPITRFARADQSTGTWASHLLTSTSALVPGAGFLVTNDGSHLAVFVGGKPDLQPNQ